MYDTAEEAKQKLAASVALYKGRPVYIHDASGSKNTLNLVFSYLPLISPSQPKETACIHSLDWDFKTIGSRLGYTPVEIGGKYTCVYTSRVPIRTSRQGLDNKTVYVTTIPLPDTPSFTGNWGVLIQREGIVSTLTDKYLSTSEAYLRLTSEPQSFKAIPVHRKLMLNFDRVSPPSLFYRFDKVAYTEDGKLFKLAPHKKFLREELVDMIGLKVA